MKSGGSFEPPEYALAPPLGVELGFLWKVPEQKCWPETSLFLEKYESFLGHGTKNI